MVGARAIEYYAAEAKERQREAGKAHGRGKEKVVANWPQPISEDEEPSKRKPVARDYAGKAVGVGGRTIDRATRVLREAEPEVIKAVEEGRMAVTWASEIAELPAEEQREIAAESQGRRLPRKVETEVKPKLTQSELVGLGIIKAHEAIAILDSIPVKDPLRKRGFQVVAEWIECNTNPRRS